MHGSSRDFLAIAVREIHIKIIALRTPVLLSDRTTEQFNQPIRNISFVCAYGDSSIDITVTDKHAHSPRVNCRISTFEYTVIVCRHRHTITNFKVLAQDTTSLRGQRVIGRKLQITPVGEFDFKPILSIGIALPRLYLDESASVEDVNGPRPIMKLLISLSERQCEHATVHLDRDYVIARDGSHIAYFSLRMSFLVILQIEGSINKAEIREQPFCTHSDSEFEQIIVRVTCVVVHALFYSENLNRENRCLTVSETCFSC